jgi:hypothetical protein
MELKNGGLMVFGSINKSGKVKLRNSRKEESKRFFLNENKKH